MTSANGIAHIEESGNRSYCGRSLVMQLKLLDLQHAESCLSTGARVTPCKVCLKRARAAQGKGANDGNV